MVARTAVRSVGSMLVTSILAAGCASAPAFPAQRHTNKFAACSSGEEAAPLVVRKMREVPAELLGKAVSVRFGLTPKSGRVEQLEFVSGARELLPYLDEFRRASTFDSGKATCVMGTFMVDVQ